MKVLVSKSAETGSQRRGDGAVVQGLAGCPDLAGPALDPVIRLYGDQAGQPAGIISSGGDQGAKAVVQFVGGHGRRVQAEPDHLTDAAPGQFWTDAIKANTTTITGAAIRAASIRKSVKR